MSEIAGGQFRLTCGQIGAGKSYLYVKEVEEQAKKSGKYQHIYSNIRAHAELAEGVTLMPENWEECEPDSLVIIDEVQMHEKYSKHFSNRRDSEIAGLTMIRHKRIDIWMISPNPALVNSDVRNLVNQYFWLEPVGEKTTKCFCFDKVYTNVTKSIKDKNAYDSFTYTIKDKYTGLYKSTVDGKASGRNFNLNMKLISFIVGLIIVCLIIAGLVFYLVKGTKTKVNDMQAQETKNNVDKGSNQKATATNGMGVLPSTGDMSVECRKGINVEKPECVQYFNTLTENRMSVTDPTVQYDVSNPYDQDAIQKVAATTYQVKSLPKFSGCTYFNGKYQAYTEQGTKLSVSKSDCDRLIRDNDRPYDYFRERPTASVSSNNTVVAQTDVERYPSHQELNYANNQVQEHLQARTVNGANAL